MTRLLSIDLSRFDTARLADLDDKVVAALRDVAYVTVGLGVLGVQQAQVRRRELVSAMRERVTERPAQVDELVRSLEARVTDLETAIESFEAKVDKAVERIEERLPDQAAALVGQAHGLAKAARRQVRGLIRSAA